MSHIYRGAQAPTIAITVNAGESIFDALENAGIEYAWGYVRYPAPDDRLYQQVSLAHDDLIREIEEECRCGAPYYKEREIIVTSPLA